MPRTTRSSEGDLAGRRALGAALRDRRQDRGWTLAELSQRSGISIGHLSDAERGSGKGLLTLEALHLIADAHGVLVTDLLHQVPPYGRRPDDGPAAGRRIPPYEDDAAST